MARLLVITEGIESPVLELRLGVNRVGRGPENHFRIDHRSVSKRHCELELGDGVILLRDCRSARGTFVNGRRITRAKLRAGQTVRLGAVELLVESTEVKVAIPQYDRPSPAQPKARPASPEHCEEHPDALVTHQCTHCHRFMCGECVTRLRLVGKKERMFCPKCTHPVRFLAEPAPPVALPDGTMLCNRHPRTRASHRCTNCREVMCTACVHWIRTGRAKLKMFCPLCDCPVEVIKARKPKGKMQLSSLKQTVQRRLLNSLKREA